MNNLTPRQQFILSTLLNEGSLDIKNLQKQFDISDKTVYREVTAINKSLNKHNINIFNDSNSNLIISGNVENMQKLKSSTKNIPLQWLLNKHQRQIMIITELLLSYEPIKVSYFSTKYNVAMASISFDLDSIEHWLTSKNLFLIRKKSYGIQVEGLQWTKRNALIELFFSLKPLEELLGFFYDEKFDPSVKILFKIAFGEELTELIKNILKQSNLQFLQNNDVKYFEFFIQLLISIKHTENNMSVILPYEVTDKILSSNDYKELKELSDDLNSNGIVLPKAELAYLILYLNDYSYSCDSNLSEIDINLESIINELLEETSKKININLNCDKQLVNNLYQHFKQSINILNLGFKIINPLIDEIKVQYSSLFEIVSNICKLIFSRYNLIIPPDEIGYITLHIDVAIKKLQFESKKLKTFIVCPTGMSTAKILANKIKAIFSDIDVVNMGSVFDWRNTKENTEYDLIVSTFNIENKKDEIEKHENIITVSPFLTIDDISKINEFIFKHKKIKESVSVESQSVSNSDTDLVEDYRIVNSLLEKFQLKNIEIDSFNELIDYITDDIENIGITEDKEQIKELIYEREKKGNVVIPSAHVALIHTRSDKILTPFIGVYRIKKPLQMASIGFSVEEVDTFFVMLAKVSNSNDALKLLGRISIALIENKDFIKKLRTADVESNKEIIRNIIHTREDY